MKVSKTNSCLSFKMLPVDKVALQVGEYVLNYRRPFKNEVLSVQNRNYILSVIKDKTLPFIKKEEPITMAIVGFSMKCPSPVKVVSQNADRAEFEALQHLNNFVSGLSEIYKPGAKLDIYTDGRMFAKSIIGFSDEKVTKYVEQLKTFLRKFQLSRLSIHTPEEFFSGNFDEVRSAMVRNFPANNSKLNTDAFTQEYRRFMRDFYAKDIRAQNSTISIKKSKKLGERIANEVINLADTYSSFIQSLYPKSMLRLSVHGKPFDNTDKKIGVFLNSQNSNCPMPWHSAAIKINTGQGNEVFLYEKKSILEKLGAQFVPDIDGKGCFYKFV